MFSARDLTERRVPHAAAVAGIVGPFSRRHDTLSRDRCGRRPHADHEGREHDHGSDRSTHGQDLSSRPA